MRASNNPTAKNLRRIKALHRLEYDLQYGQAHDVGNVARIQEESDTLRKRIMPPEVARSSRSKIYRGVK